MIAALRNEPDVGRHFVHHLIATTAKELAAEFWEQMCSGQKRMRKVHPKVHEGSRKFRAAWPDQDVFVEARWNEFIDVATGALTLLLGKPDLNETSKAEINEALRLNNLVRPRKLSPEAELAGNLNPKGLIR